MPGMLATMSAVTHRYGEVVALDGLDLEIRPGEVVAVLGPNGAGKTTAIGLLLGSLCAQEGAATATRWPCCRAWCGWKTTGSTWRS